MKVFPYTDVEAKTADEGAVRLKVRWLVTKDIGASNFAMRLFEMQPGGNSPLHSHDWEHEVFILEGEGTVVDDCPRKERHRAVDYREYCPRRNGYPAQRTRGTDQRLKGARSGKRATADDSTIDQLDHRAAERLNAGGVGNGAAVDHQRTAAGGLQPAVVGERCTLQD